MKTLRVSFAVLAVAVVLLLTGGTPQAFHSGGVAECAGCHSIHNPKVGGSYLLLHSDPSSTCLSCHESADTAPTGYHISTAGTTFTGTALLPVERTPGGDFAWLKKSYTYAGENGPETEDGSTHGHNIVASEFGYVQDTVSTAPGGTFPSSALACTSCHDPHGRYRRLANGTVSTTGGLIMASGSYTNLTTNEPSATQAVGVYRLLAGAGYSKNGVTFPGVPAAKVPSSYNMSEATNQLRVAYGVGTTSGHTTWGLWCATCHPNMHKTFNTWTHPVDVAMSSTTNTNYNSYVKSGDMSGSQATSFSSLVPFASGTGDYTVLAGLARNNAATYAGPVSGDQVTCLSCHRAHASGMMYSLRYDMEYEFMTKNGQYVGSDNPAIGTTGRGPLQSRGRTIADWQAAYYDRPATQFATYQRVLCNKCHAKD